MAKGKNKEVAVNENSDLMIFGENTGEVVNYQEDAGLGNENVGQDDLATPRIVLLQDLSKAVKSGNIAGAAPGMFHNTVTDELFTEKYVIPLDYQKEWAVFKSRKAGGGYFGSFPNEQEASDSLETLEGVPSMYDVIESARQVFLTVHGSGERKGQIDSPAVMHFASTALTASNTLNSAIQMTLGSNVPRFAGVWKMTVETKTNGNNEQWYGPAFTFAGKLAGQMYYDVREMYYSITGKVDPKKVNMETGEINAA